MKRKTNRKTTKSRRTPKPALWVPLSGIPGVDAKEAYAENTRVTRAETGN